MNIQPQDVLDFQGGTIKNVNLQPSSITTANLPQAAAVVQATNKSTAVISNGMSGQITMNNAGLATVTAVSFAVTNSSVAAGDFIDVQHQSAGTLGSYLFAAHTTAAGSFKIMVFNVTGGTLSEAIVLIYKVKKNT